MFFSSKVLETQTSETLRFWISLWHQQRGQRQTVSCRYNCYLFDKNTVYFREISQIKTRDLLGFSPFLWCVFVFMCMCLQAFQMSVYPFCSVVWSRDTLTSFLISWLWTSMSLDRVSDSSLMMLHTFSKKNGNVQMLKNLLESLVFL